MPRPDRQGEIVEGSDFAQFNEVGASYEGELAGFSRPDEGKGRNYFIKPDEGKMVRLPNHVDLNKKLIEAEMKNPGKRLWVFVKLETIEESGNKKRSYSVVVWSM